MNSSLEGEPCRHCKVGACMLGKAIYVGTEWYVKYQPPGAEAQRLEKNDMRAPIVFYCKPIASGTLSQNITYEQIAIQKRCEDYEPLQK